MFNYLFMYVTCGIFIVFILPWRVNVRNMKYSTSVNELIDFNLKILEGILGKCFCMFRKENRYVHAHQKYYCKITISVLLANQKSFLWLNSIFIFYYYTIILS